jgi:hypothetical protein
LTTLSKITIHSSISLDNYTLENFVPKEKLFAWADRCQLAYGIIELNYIIYGQELKTWRKLWMK